MGKYTRTSYPLTSDIIDYYGATAELVVENYKTKTTEKDTYFLSVDYEDRYSCGCHDRSFSLEINVTKLLEEIKGITK